MSGESRIGDGTADQPNGETGGTALGLNLEARLPPHATVDTVAPAAADELRLLQRETEVASDPQRMAALLHEAGNLLEFSIGDQPAAVAAYSRALSSDAGLIANVWALRRLAEQRGSWDEAIKLLDAEVGFAAALAPADRADLLVERGRILEDRLGRDGDAAASYRSALAACPDHPAALLALLLLAARLADPAGMETSLGGLARRSLDPLRRACFSVELARAQRAGGDAAGRDRAFETLRAALGASDGPPPAPLLREMNRVSLADGGAALRLRTLDELLRHPGDDAAVTTALLREKARLLAGTARDFEGATAALQRALELTPAHPLLWRELAEAADQAAHPDILAHMAEIHAVEPGQHAALVLRHAEALARGGRIQDALAVLDGTTGLAQHDFQVWSARIRYLAMAGDVAGLAAAFHLEAELARQGVHARWTRSELGAEARGRLAADALVRSATLREHGLADQAAAEDEIRLALEQAPHHRPAVDALERILVARGRWSELGELLAAELDADGSSRSETDPARAERRAYLLESLVAVQRDRLNAPRVARERQGQLDELHGQDLRSRLRTVDLDLRLLAQAEPDAAVGPSTDDLLDLQRPSPGPVAEGALQLEAARSAARAGDLASAEELARQATALDPAGLGGATVEALQADVDRRLETISVELSATESAGRAEVARALRYRVAFLEISAGRLAAAVDTLAPLRAAADALAVAWSDELARRSGDPDVLISLLLEAGADSEPDRLVGLGEALEARGLAGDGATAASHFEEAMLSASSTDAALGLLRQRAAESDLPGVLAALRCAAEASPQELGDALRRECEMLMLTCTPEGHASPSLADAAGDPEREVAVWMAAARARRDDEIAAAELAMAAHLPETDSPGGSHRAVTMARALARTRLQGAATALAAFERARGATNDPSSAAWLLTDMDGELTARGELDEVRLRRAERASGSMRTALWLEVAWSAERQGRLQDAVAAYGRVLATDAGCIPAVDGLRRVAGAGGDRLGEARALARLGEMATGRMQRAQLFHRAACLYEKAGHQEAAIALHWRTLEHAPLHDDAFQQLRSLLIATADATELDRLLSFRLSHLTQEQARVPIYWERARNRLDGLRDRRKAAQDLHRILAIQPYHTEAIRVLAQLCLDVGAHARAAELLERYLQVESDPVLRNTARLTLAAVYKTTGDLRSAIGTLSDAVETNPKDLQARERLAELYVDVGQWQNALELLRDMTRLAPDPRASADIKLRIALILREQQDIPGALEQLRAAAGEDPLGDAPRELLAVSEEAGGSEEHDAAVNLVMDGVRRVLQADPLDATALHQLRALSKAAGLDDAATVAAQLLAVIGETPSSPATAPVKGLRRPPAGAVAAHLMHPASGGLLSELWPHLCDAVWQLDLAALDRSAFSRASRISSAGGDVAWLQEAAQALDVAGIAIHVGSVGEQDVVATDSPTPALAVGTAALRGDDAIRFKAGRALLLLRQRAAVLDLMRPEVLARVVGAAAMIAGAPSPGQADAQTADLARALQRVLGRKERKALSLEADRFGMAINVADWHRAVLRTADRAGLLLCGDLGVAVRTSCGLGPRLTRSELREQRRAMELIDWALGASYLALRNDTGAAGS